MADDYKLFSCPSIHEIDHKMSILQVADHF